jgi:hypothetical protein
VSPTRATSGPPRERFLVFLSHFRGALRGGLPANSRESAGPSSPLDCTPLATQPDHSPKNKGRARRPVCFHSPRWCETCRSHANARHRGPRRSGNPTCALKNRSRAGPRSARNSNCGFSPITFSDDRQTRACQESCWGGLFRSSIRTRGPPASSSTQHNPINESQLVRCLRVALGPGEPPEENS